MDKMTAAYERLIEKFTQWAQTEDNIRAAIIIGSRARRDHPADEWSDLDMFIFARDPEPYWATTDWLHPIGELWLSFLEPTPGGRELERRVLFEGGLDVDFIPSSVTNLDAMLKQGFPPDVADMVHRGIWFVVDKEGFAERLQNIEVSPPTYSPPTESQLLNVVNDFWYHIVWTGKHLRRGEVWLAKSCCDTYLKNLLYQVLVWHAHTFKVGEVDTWMHGRFLEEWADTRAVDALPTIFAHYDEEDIWRALLATMKLFRWLAVETADLLEYSYPSYGEEHALEFIYKLFSERSHS